jgi:outer membrane protein OmpA-like peptidoglycan-associated protein
MTGFRRLRVAVSALGVGFVVVVVTSSALAATSCAEIEATMHGSLAARDIEDAQKSFAQAASCDAGTRSRMGMAVATAMYNRAIAATPKREDDFTAVLSYGRPWQALATLGDFAAERRDYKLAAQRYQEALTELADPERTLEAPGEEVILQLQRKAEQAGLLSPEYVPTPRSRDGSNAGLAASEIRGIAIGLVAFPVQFEFDSTTFTRLGAEAAADMASFLKNEKQAVKIVLIGHTDPRGETDYNQRLSESRATALAAYLKKEGVSLEIATLGKGESEPYRPDDPAKYTEEQTFQMDRRVEVRRVR